MVVDGMILEVVLLLLVDNVCIFVVIVICLFFKAPKHLLNTHTPRKHPHAPHYVFCVCGGVLIAMFEFIWVWVVYMNLLKFEFWERCVFCFL